MQVERYSEKSIAVYDPWSANLAALGGAFNVNLRGRPGWIFPRTKEQELIQYLAQTNMNPPAEVIVYTDKSVAFYDPYATNFHTLGGTFNKNLRGRAGWIFPKNREFKLMEYVTQLNGGQPVQIMEQQVVATPTTPLAPIITQPAMSPRTAMARLTVAQPTIPFPQTTMAPFPRITIPQPTVPFAQPTIPQITIPQTQPTVQAGMQIVTYTIPLPTVGQRVLLNIQDTNLPYVVAQADKNANGFVDDILIRQDIEDVANAAVSRVVVMAGKWRVFCMQEDHSLQFN